MRLRKTIITLSALCVAAIPLSGAANPPDHAPAHGYRAKHDKHRHHDRHQHEERRRTQAPKGGVEIVFDSERGIYVGIGLPNILFHDGSYYRESGGSWQVSLNGHGEWALAARASVPQLVVQAGHTSYRRSKNSWRWQRPAKLRWNDRW